VFSLGQVDLLPMLPFGPTSSLHCTTVRGPIMALASAPATVGTGKSVRRPEDMGLWQSPDRLGRGGVTHGLIGAVLGLLWTSLVLAPRERLAGAVTRLVLGSVMAFVGVWQLVRGVSRAGATDNWLGRASRALITQGSARGRPGLGLLTRLPVICVAVSRIALAGSMSGGALVTAVFRRKGAGNLLRQGGIPSREMKHPALQVPGHERPEGSPQAGQPAPAANVDDHPFPRHPR
jgi:hypothetical protein